MDSRRGGPTSVLLLSWVCVVGLISGHNDVLGHRVGEVRRDGILFVMAAEERAVKIS